MKSFSLILVVTLLLGGCKRSTLIEGEWVGKDTTLYLSCYEDRSFGIVDSIRVCGGRFSWKGVLREEMLYGLSANPKSRHPSSFFPDSRVFKVRVWENGEIVTQRSGMNALLQRTLATQFDADTLLTNHPESPVTAYMATRFLVNTVPYDSLKMLRKKITLTNHPYVDELDATLQAMKQIHPGAFAPPVAGVEFGDTTLLVFHATWCPDCLAVWPSINTYLETHPSTHLVKLDIDSVGWNGESTKAYAVRGVPSIFLIAKGKILRIGL